jgi:hypothetical protein
MILRPAASAISGTLILLLILRALSKSQGDELVDQIWHWKAPDASFKITYIVTSHTPLAAHALFGSFAKLHHSRIHRDDYSTLFDQDVQYCVQQHLFPTDICPPPEHVGHNSNPQDAERERVARETFLRKALFWRIAWSELYAADYFVFLDFRAPYWSDLRHDQLFNFQRLLMLEKPIVAVPFHHCNTIDAPARTSALPIRSWSMISSIHDTTFVAVHASARNLLLPLHESVLSLVCRLFLKSRVLQFDLGNLEHSGSQASGCRETDLANQDSIFNFVSSLKSKQYTLALPFSPRISTAVASVSAPVTFTLDGTIETASSPEAECPVDCNFYYWRIHAAFECCFLISEAMPLYNAKENYMKISQNHMLPHIESISGLLMAQNYTHDLVGKRAPTISCGRTENYSCHVIVPDYKQRSDVTHPFQKFEILLSTQPVILDNACADRDLIVDFVSLKHFRLTVLPENMNLLELGAENDFQVQIQLVLSAHNGAHSEYENCAVFAQIARLQVVLACDSLHSVYVFDHFNVIHQQKTHESPWFYDPIFSSFEVAPSMLTDTLRYHYVNVSMRTSCADILNVSVDASVELRSFCDFSRIPASCISHVLNATSQTITHHSKDEKRRSGFETNAKPNDHFDSDRLSAHVQTKLPRRLLSDFTCAGPNRRWDHADEVNFFDYGTNSRLKFSGYSMCLLRNVCFENQTMRLYVPHYFENLPDFLDFSHVKIGNKEIEFSPEFVYDSFIPADARFAANITHYAMMVEHLEFNFGHRVWEDLGGIFHAMHLFDLPREDGRVVLFNSHSMPRNQVLSLFPRAPVYIDEYPEGTCFQQMVVGFRGMNSFKHGFSVHRTAHSVEFRKHYLNVLKAAHLTAKTRRRRQVIVNMYPKVVKGNNFVWKDVCKLIENVESLLPKVVFRCVSLHKMSFEVQLQVISEATVNIWPNGVLSQSIYHPTSHSLTYFACIFP